MLRKLTMVLALVIASPVSAKIEFAKYEGPDAVQIGVGGTKITKNGIDFWTTGSPPRRYRILGNLLDRRYSQSMVKGDAIGSSKLAKHATQLGGSALIVMSQMQIDGGAVGTFNAGVFTAMPTDKTVIIFQVVQYTSD